MPKGMVITVGVGRGIEHAIALSIRNSHPDQIVFLVTEQSEKTLERIEEEAKGLGITLPPYETELIRDENDAELGLRGCRFCHPQVRRKRHRTKRNHR
jgi:hypothetical protein